MKTFDVTYQLSPRDRPIEAELDVLRFEQGVELPQDTVPDAVRDRVVGTVEDIEETSPGRFRAVVRWPLDNVGGEIAAFLNLLYGTISLRRGVRVLGVEWDPLQRTGLLHGPAFGIEELRERYAVPDRALTATALKPLGLSTEELASQCREFAAGGIDVIKDDDGLLDQPMSPFEERVAACAEAVRETGNREGHRARYFAHVSGGPEGTVERYERAGKLGADGAMICPHITGLPMLDRLARHPSPLPVIAHPSLSGTLTAHPEEGMTPDFLYGQLWRALGADLVVFASPRGRFPMGEDEGRAVCEGARTTRFPFRRAFPTPAGGMQLDALDRHRERYGPDTVFLIGGSLHQHPGGLRSAARAFSQGVR